jgi:hypothetical protein
MARAPRGTGCHGGCFKDLSPHSGEAYELGTVGHVTFHAFPAHRRRARLLGVIALLGAWMVWLPRPLQMRAILAASCYSFLEYGFTALVSSGRPFTSFAQFWGNLLYVPVLLDAYATAVDGVAQGWVRPLLYIGCFPLNVWLLELVLDQLFLLVYNRNVAWCYCTYADSHAGGALRTGHAVYWLLMGAALFFTYPSLKQATDAWGYVH